MNQGTNTALVVAAIAVTILVRGIVGGVTPLSYDEAYYWLWSNHLAAGYYDHPPAIAFAIRAGTALFGDTSLGVRFVPWILSIPATWAVARAGSLILKDAEGGLLAALFFGLMPMVGIEAVATPDALSIVAAAFVLFALVQIAETGRGVWWLGVGVAAGFALLSKYTGFFLGVGILVWLLAMPKERHWLFSFWPYLGGAIALLMFAPVLVWNSEHGWMSLSQQFGRIGAGGFTVRYLGEFLAGQLGLASPIIAVLGIVGLVVIGRPRKWGSTGGLLIATIAPAMLYFLWHSLRDRVQGNWPSFLYPAFAIAAAAGAMHARRYWSSRPWRILRASAAPLAGGMLAVVYAQAVWGIVPILRDPISRLLAVGIERVTMDLEILAEQNGAKAIVTTGYAPTAWLAFYLPPHMPVVQLNERFRYVNEPSPPETLFDAPLLYVTERRNDLSSELKLRFAEVVPLAQIARYRNGAELDEYTVYRVSGARGVPYF